MSISCKLESLKKRLVTAQITCFCDGRILQEITQLTSKPGKNVGENNRLGEMRKDHYALLLQQLDYIHHYANPAGSSHHKWVKLITQQGNIEHWPLHLFIKPYEASFETGTWSLIST